jgi:hypothetical protein
MQLVQEGASFSSIGKWVYMNVEKDAHPYLPASEKVRAGMSRPAAIMSATSSTLEMPLNEWRPQDNRL